jgi:hypothetical protein
MTLYSEVENLSKAYEQMERTAMKKVSDLKSTETQVLEAMTVVSSRSSSRAVFAIPNSHCVFAESESRTQVLCGMPKE